MQKIDNIEQLKSFVDQIRNLHQGFVTNFYLDEEKHGIWIRTGNFFFEQYDDTILLMFLHVGSFCNVFYISISFDSVVKYLQMHKNRQCVLDIVGRHIMCQPIVDQLALIGAQRANVLVRMSKIGEAPTYNTNPSVDYANLNDISIINDLLHTYFNAKLEQLPLDEELLVYVQKQCVLKYTIDGKIAGFLIFEKNISTLHLRYWFTHPKCREQKVGSELLHRFFFEGKDTKRQILWVLCDNENAIKRYEHYGFKSEDMFDYIYFY